MEKKLEVLSAALNWKEQGSPSPGHVIPADQPASVLNGNTEYVDSRERIDEQKGAVFVNSTSSPISKIMNEQSSPVQFRTMQPLYTLSPHMGDITSSSTANLMNPRDLAASSATATSTPDSELPQEPMMPSENNRGIAEIREKMVHLWSIMSKNYVKRLENVENGPRMRTPTYETDVIAQGVISLEEAECRLKIYRVNFYSNYSLVEIPLDMTVERLRRESPLLFLAIMSITSVRIEGMDKQNACITLHNQAIDAIIFETMILGNKSLELLKCLILLNMWYNTPEMYHHQKSHLITHLCTTLAIDLGLGGTTYENQHAEGIKYDRILRPYLLLNPSTPECRKLWLCVYISSIQISTIIKRPVFLMWSKYTEECCTILEHPDRTIMERRVAALARLNHLHEEISMALQGSDSMCPPDVNDPRTRCLMRYFEHKLYQISGMVNLGSSVYSTALYIVQIYLHEAVLYVPVCRHLGRAPYSEFSLAIGSMKVSIHTAQAIGWCYSGAVKCLEIIAAQSLEDLAVMPLFCYTRAAFSASTLLKLRTLYLTTPDFHQICTVKSESLGPINALMVKLEQVIARFPFANSAVNFCFVLQVLICHFDRQLHYFFHPEENPNKVKTEEAMSPRSEAIKSGSEGPKRGLYDTADTGSRRSTGYSADHDRTGSETPNNVSSTNTPGGGISSNVNIYLRAPSPVQPDGRRYSELQPDSPLNILSSVAIDSTLQKRLDQDGSEHGGYLDDNNGSAGGSATTASTISTNTSLSSTNPAAEMRARVAVDQRPGTQEHTPKPSGLTSMPLSRRLSAVYGSNTGNGGYMALGDVGQTGPAGGNGDYPSWLVTDDFWKDLVTGAEALSGFDMY